MYIRDHPVPGAVLALCYTSHLASAANASHCVATLPGWTVHSIEGLRGIAGIPRTDTWGWPGNPWGALVVWEGSMFVPSRSEAELLLHALQGPGWRDHQFGLCRECVTIEWAYEWTAAVMPHLSYVTCNGMDSASVAIT